MPTMTLSYLVYPIGTPVPGMPIIPPIPVQAGAQLAPLTAPPVVDNPTPPPPPAAQSYAFAFWDINATQYGTPLAPPSSWTVPQQDFSATAWYWPNVGGPAPLVTTYAFSLNKNQVIPGQTPIHSVTGAPWTSPSTTVATTGDSPVVITADTLIGGSGRFVSWMQFGDGTVSGLTLTVPANRGAQAIAFYGIPVPDPCAGIRAEISALTASLSGEIPPSKAVLQELDRLVGQLVSCEQQYGELP
jgi:hypothetical protein